RGLSNIIDRFLWTGPDAANPMPGANVRGVTLVDGEEGIYHFVRVDLEKSLDFGEEYTFEIEWDPIENWRGARPFISGSTDDPTHEIAFKVNVPPRYRGSESAMCETSHSVEAFRHIKSEEKKFGPTGEVEWVIRPKL